MATITITRGNTLPDSSAKADFHNLIDQASLAISGIVNADISASAAIASSKLDLSAIAQAVNFGQGANIASATTTDIGAATGNYVDVTGTTTITGLGTVQAGTWRLVRFTGALTLTYNASSLILPGSANITTVANDVALFISLGSGNWFCAFYTRRDGTNLINALPEGYMYGGQISNNAGDATNDLDISATVCRDATDAANLDIGAMTKRVDAAWAAGTNQGGLDTGSIGASEDLVYIWAIGKAGGAAADYLFSKSPTAPTMPTDYTLKRLLGARRWDGAAWMTFKSYGNANTIDVWYTNADDADLLIINAGTQTTFTDVDGGDGGAEVFPTGSILAFVKFQLATAATATLGISLRVNGSSSTGEALQAMNAVSLGTSNPRLAGRHEIELDSNGIFEYLVSTDVSVNMYASGYREVR